MSALLQCGFATSLGEEVNKTGSSATEKNSIGRFFEDEAAENAFSQGFRGGLINTTGSKQSSKELT
ncbi:hypothetical protein [Rhizobium sp. GCM10022189]|uniref:hypothetical protein n=1 Tax=Rhizobium sp. GCM10022189 TaxID=3252654 RepID=UPI003606FE7C